MTIRPFQDSLFFGLAYCLPLVIWSLAQAGETNGGLFEAGALAARILTVLQAGVITLWIPWNGTDERWSVVLLDVLWLTLIPLPLVIVWWLAGAGSAMVFVGAESALLAYAAILLVGVRRLPRVRKGVSVPTIVQVAGITALWALRDEWLGWLGL